MDAAALRREFPVLERFAYLNAGTDGPLPREAEQAGREALAAQAARGRYVEHFEAREALGDELRAAYAGLLGCHEDDVALTTSTTDGIGRVLAGLDLGPSDEIVTSEGEHPGVTGPLIVARERGARIVAAPLAQITDAVTPATTLVVCSHVGWHTGELVDPAVAQLDVPVVLDGAQGLGAIRVDLEALGCDAYAAAGQKWLCGADGTGVLYVSAALRERARPVVLGYTTLEDESLGLDAVPHRAAQRFDTASIPREGAAVSAAALRVLGRHGWEDIHARACALARELVERLDGAGREVAPRGETTLVAWREEDPEAMAARAFAAGVIVRHLPGTPYVRASVGAWNDEADLDRLLGVLSG
jgi:selenocysteine lyase/cysteine desulfurase